MSIIPHTNITVTIRRFILLICYTVFVEEKEASLYAIHSSTDTTFVQIVYRPLNI